MRGFGSYLKETKIDFTKLAEGGLYIITGDTGAGKTTIFDAVSYALFGEVSGSVRGNKYLRSKYADSSVPTYARVEFEHLGKKYKVERNPEYIGMGKRGEKKITADATLYYPDGRTVNKVNEVTSAVTEIISLNRDQFSQIAMIAQGDFLKSLMASTDTRTEIFRKIFDTAKYERLQSRIDELCKEAESRKAAINENVERALASVGEERSRTMENLTSAECVAYLLGEISSKEELLKEEASKSEELKRELATENERMGVAKTVEDSQKSLKLSEEEIERSTAEKESLSKEAEKLKADGERINSLKLKIAAERENSEKYGLKEGLIKEEKRVNNDLTDLENKLKECESEIARLNALREENSKYIAEHKGDGLQLERITNEGKRLKEEIEALKRSAETLKKIEEEEKLCEKRESEIKAAKIKLDKKKERYDRLYSAFIACQASLMAEELKDGEKCPVCGSTSHPERAHAALERVVQSEVDAEKRDVDKLVAAINSAESGLNGDRSRIKEKRSSTEGELLRSGYTEFNINFLLGEAILKEKQKDALSDDYKKVNGFIKISEKKEKENADAERSVKELLSKKDSLSDKKIALSGEKQRISLEIQQAEALPFPSKAASDRQIKLWSAEVESYNKAVSEIEEKIKTADGALNTALGKRENALLVINGADSADVAEISVKIDKITAELAERDNRKDGLSGEINVLKRAKEDVEGLIKEAEDCEKKYSVLKKLSATANGNLSGKEKIRLETFVQMRYFERVLYRANKRLYGMSDGQYELVRRENNADKRSQGGLDIDIKDYSTNSVRPVNTLSGGESFMASLSLALGFSDEVQSASGGVRIDSMFIDEGFGSLSEEALNNAVKTLSSLNEGGISIGIISHVKELRERIENQIIVKKGDFGSEVTLKLP